MPVSVLSPDVVVTACSCPLPVSVPSPDVVVAPALVRCPSGSAIACRCRRHPLSSVARQRPPSPVVVVVACSRPLPVSVRPLLPSSLPPALVPCPSASPHLTSSSRRLSSLARQRPPSPTAPALAIPSTSVVQRRHIIVATKPSSPPPPPPISCYFGFQSFDFKSSLSGIFLQSGIK